MPSAYSVTEITELNRLTVESARVTESARLIREYVDPEATAQKLNLFATINDCVDAWRQTSSDPNKTAWATLPRAFRQRILTEPIASKLRPQFYRMILDMPQKDAVAWMNTNPNGRAALISAAAKDSYRVELGKPAQWGIEVLGREVTIAPGNDNIEEILSYGSTFEQLATVYPSLRVGLEELHAYIGSIELPATDQTAKTRQNKLRGSIAQFSQSLAKRYVQLQISKQVEVRR